MLIVGGWAFLARGYNEKSLAVPYLLDRWMRSWESTASSADSVKVAGGMVNKLRKIKR